MLVSFQHCGSDVLSSNTRICTGHISKAPTQYTFLVEKGFIDIVNRKVGCKINRIYPIKKILLLLIWFPNNAFMSKLLPGSEWKWRTMGFWRSFISTKKRSKVTIAKLELKEGTNLSSSISKIKEFHTFYFYFRAIFTAMVYDNGIKRPLVRAPNSAGVQRLITRLETIVT